MYFPDPSTKGRVRHKINIQLKEKEKKEKEEKKWVDAYK